MQRYSTSLFEGLSEQVLGGRENRSFARDSIVLAEGDSPHELYVIESGTADVFVTDGQGREHTVDDLCHGYDFVFVQVGEDRAPPLEGRKIRLTRALDPPPAGDDVEYTLCAWQDAGGRIQVDRRGI